MMPQIQAKPSPATWVKPVAVVLPPGDGETADKLTPTADDMGGTAD